MFSDCNQCSFNFRNKIEHKIIDPAYLIKWSLWTTSDEGRAVKVDYEGSVQNCVRVLQTKIKQFLFHVFIKRKQSNYFEMLRDNSSDERCLLQVDYSENFSSCPTERNPECSLQSSSIVNLHRSRLGWCKYTDKNFRRIINRQKGFITEK